MRRAFLVAFLAGIILCGFAMVGNIQFGMAQTATNVTGIINTDTTWTKANSPYNLTGNVLVSQGVNLTIQPGVTVNFNSYFMDVGGRLFAKGTETDKIVMRGSGIAYTGEWKGRLDFLASSSNSTLEYAEITSTPNVIIGIYSSPTINQSTINGTDGTAISIIDGSPMISRNVISNNNGNGILIDKTSTGTTCSPTISENTIRNNGGLGILVNHGTPLINGNVILNNNEGIRYEGWWTYDSVLISNNAISGSAYGININVFAAIKSFTIEKNLIVNCQTGVGITVLLSALGGGPGIIRNNTIFGNTIGVAVNVPLDLSINQNNLQGNTNYAVVLSISQDLNATNNWWGTTDTQAINQAIYDFNDDFRLGHVDFSPMLNASNQLAPVVPIFTIVVNATAGGSISPSGNVTVSYGRSQTFNVSANQGYQVASVLMDGRPATAPYTFSGVLSDGHTISATFTQISIPENFPTLIILTLLAIATLAVTVGFNRKSQTKPLA